MAIHTPKLERLGISESDWVPADVAGDRFVNDENTVVWLDNQGAADITVTAKAQRADNQGIAKDFPIVVPAGAIVKSLSFDANRFNDGDGHVRLGYSTHVDLYLAVVRQEGYRG